MRLLIVCLITAPVFLLAELPEKIDFNKHIRPILSDRCFKCHGPDGGEFGEMWKGGLRLDTEKGAKANLSKVKLEIKNAKRKAEGKEPSTKLRSPKFAIVPGNVKESSLVERIFTDDEDDVMPPPDSNLKLSADEKALLKAWVKQGADWGEHWSYVAPQKVALPKVENKQWAHNEIDHFILKKLERKGIKPSEEANRITWLRRVYLDLTGLPPTPQEADAFVADKNPNAYEKVVDKILKTDAYAEKMTLKWLDSARYADTSGYQYDKPRSMWPWRDWVLQAFKENKKYDEFVTEQLAGDLLPNSTLQQQIATGFNRNHGFTIEGGIIDEEYRIQYVNDRVITFGTLFLGMTMDCTRCHNHKYDPLTADDFYSLSAFFDKINEPGKGGGRGVLAVKPFVNVPVYNEREVAGLENELKNLKSKKLSKSEEADFHKWMKSGNKLKPFGKVISATSKGGATVTAVGDESYVFSGKNPAKDTYTFKVEVKDVKVQSIILQGLTDKSMEKGGPGRSPNGNSVLTAVSIKKDKGRKDLPLTAAEADYSQDKFPVGGLLKKRNSGWGIGGDRRKPVTAVFQLKDPLLIKGKEIFTVTLQFQSKYSQHQLGRVKIQASSLSAKETLVAYSGNTDEKSLRQYYLNNVLDNGNIGKEIKSLESKLKDLKKTVPVMVMKDDKKDRQTYILERGEYDKKGKKVFARIPAVLPPFTKDMPKNRLGLAKWLLSEDQPLFARVTVNRYWQMLFGIGLVKTTEDFGAQGDEPSHPELLDWLAVDFRESGWDLHHLLKKMVLSSAYRQASTIRKDISDPENRLLARGPRFRLAAEIIRDQALKTAGLLSDKTGGPSVYPYQPPGLWKELSNRPGFQMIYKESDGDSLYRKSMYTFWKRAMPNPSMTIFDAPERDVCVVKRARTNTPLQALVLLHDPTYVEASRALAEKALVNTASGKIDDAVVNAFRTVLVRRPSMDEVKILVDLYKKKLALLKDQPDLVERILSVGKHLHESKIDKVKLAAFSSVCQAIYNLSETVTRN